MPHKVYFERTTLPPGVKSRPGVIELVGSRPEAARGSAAWIVKARLPYAVLPVDAAAILATKAAGSVSVEHNGDSIDDLTETAVGLVFAGPPVGEDLTRAELMAHFSSAVDLSESVELAGAFVDLIQGFVQRVEEQGEGETVTEHWLVTDPVEFAFLSVLVLEAVAFVLVEQTIPSNVIGLHLTAWWGRLLGAIEHEENAEAAVVRGLAPAYMGAISRAVELRPPHPEVLGG